MLASAATVGLIGIGVTVVGLAIQFRDWQDTHEANKKLATVREYIEALEIIGLKYPAQSASSSASPTSPLAKLDEVDEILNAGAREAQIQNKTAALKLTKDLNDATEGRARKVFLSWGLIIIGALFQIPMLVG